MTAYRVVEALHGVFAAALPTRQLFYGPPADSEWSGEDPSTWLAHSEPDAASPPITVVASPFTEAGDQQLAVTVSCAAAHYVGSDDVSGTLQALEEHVAALRAAVLDDRTLGGAAQNVEFGAQQTIEFSRVGGVRVLCLFTVEVTTWSS